MTSKLEAEKQIEVLSNAPSHSGSTSDDEVAPEAIGGTNADLPPGYYRSPSFIGTVLVGVGFVNACCYADIPLLRLSAWVIVRVISDGYCLPTLWL
jgi:hypothetical protein